LPFIGGIAYEGVVRFYEAVIALLIGSGEQRNNTGSTFNPVETVLHSGHEAGMAKIFVLKKGCIARFAQDAVNGDSEIPV
jgi:hypothetical protein